MNPTIVAFFATIAAAAALPQASPTPGDTTVTVCTGENFSGTCKTIAAPLNACQTLPAPVYKNTGSFGVEKSALCRLTYTADTCTLHGDAFVYPPGVAQLHSNFTDPATGVKEDVGVKLTSFLCQGCSNC